jgi:hypothetical protein
MLTASQIIEEATYRAKVPGYSATFALRNLNALLSDICQHYDLALARGVYNFEFNPSLSTLFGSGPYPLPLDYLRTSGSSGASGASGSVWYLYPAPAYPAGQPITMIPIDLAEFDTLPQLPTPTTPEYWVTDMGGPLTQRIVLSTVGDIDGVTAIISNVPDVTPLRVGLSCAGEGITPGSMITAIDTGTGQVTLSADTTAVIDGASVFFGIAPVAYVYPPPLSNYPVTVRYQRQMPPIVSPATVPWMPDEGAVINDLASRLCEISDDDRADRLAARAQMRYGKYIAKADDKTNRSQPIQLDPRSFGVGNTYARARMTKKQGWG